MHGLAVLAVWGPGPQHSQGTGFRSGSRVQERDKMAQGRQGHLCSLAR